MKAAFLTIGLLFSILSGNHDISMCGIKVNDPEKNLKSIKFEKVGDEQDGKTTMKKFRTENGNDFSLTILKGKVVYMENDWLQNKNSTKPLLTDFEFGITSLKDIRKIFGTNGFTYKKSSYLKTATDLIMFNCFDVDSPNNEVLVIITKVSLMDDVTENNVAEHLKLDALILGNSEYLSKLWGKEKVYDPNYKKIKI